MSTALLQELHQVLRRIFIAGSDLALGDYRLKRMLPQFQQLGERAPIYKRLGEGISALIEPADIENYQSADQLQDLNLLLTSVLRTQGMTAPQGELRPLENRPVSFSTFLSYRKLAAVEAALTTTGSNRYEVVVHAYDVGMFRDLRLLPLAIRAIGDPYSEIAEFAMQKILPSYGFEVIPYLIDSFDPMGGRVESRKLQVIGQAGGGDVIDLIFQAAESGSEEVRLTAIRLLAAHATYESALLSWTKDKKKSIREAAYQTLAEMNSEVAVERIYEAFAGKDIEIAAKAAAKCSSEQLTDWLVRDLGAQLEHAIEHKDDKKKTEASQIKIKHFLTALEGKRSDTLYELFTEVTRQYALYISFAGLDILDAAAYYLEHENSLEALEALYVLEQHNTRYLSYAFRASFRLLSPSELYEHYVHSVRNKWKMKTNKETQKKLKEFLSILEQQVIAYPYQLYPNLWSSPEENSYLRKVEMMPVDQVAQLWDSRWLDWLIEVQATHLVCVFARPDHTESQSFLLKRIHDMTDLRHQSFDILLLGLERAGVDASIQSDLLMNVLEQKRSGNLYAFEGHVLEYLYKLPLTYQERLAAMIQKYRYTAREQLQYVWNEMERKKQEAVVADSV
ncbi:HEAT repeat domain-containing protein [Paenibacillus albiflavus]|uniref:HEAT repeat domain-containing protein n=1 Tax=Paenibacillus albiflavus TaxID=2545760 RepID=A0A4R4EMV9_9BACL|nr:HEAT repeat domain-containing protein [Paenibacillus albiflavus]TCZ80730.1 HEAT repeat domain-containing protein [Paenibacillus albiflavus]